LYIWVCTASQALEREVVVGPEDELKMGNPRNCGLGPCISRLFIFFCLPFSVCCGKISRP